MCVCVCLCPFHVNKAYRYSCQLAVLIQALGQMLQYPPPVAVFIHLHLSICPWSSAHHFNSSASVPLSSPLSSTRVGSPVFPSVSLSRRGGNLNQTRAMFCCVCRERRQANWNKHPPAYTSTPAVENRCFFPFCQSSWESSMRFNPKSFKRHFLWLRCIFVCWGWENVRCSYGTCPPYN